MVIKGSIPSQFIWLNKLFFCCVLCSIVCGKPCDVSLDFCACCWLPCSNEDGWCHGVTCFLCDSSSVVVIHKLCPILFSHRGKRQLTDSLLCYNYFKFQVSFMWWSFKWLVELSTRPFSADSFQPVYTVLTDLCTV